MTTASSAGAPIVAQGVTKDYGEGAGIHELDLVVPQGTILGVVGPSGAGKTTTIRILTGAVDPEKGDVRVLGEDPRRFRRATRERIGYMPQLFTLYPDLTAEENVDFVASLFGMLWRRRRRRVGEVLRFTQLIDAKHRPGGEPVRRHAAAPRARVRPRARAGPPVPRRAHRRYRSHPPPVDLGGAPSAQGCRPDAAGHHAVRHRGRGVRPGRAHHGGPAGRDGAARTLRRDALGGDLLEVETKAPFDPEQLAGRPHILRVETRGLRSFWAAVDDGPQMLPVIDDLVAEAGGEVVSARAITPSFDEVFAALVRRERGSTTADEAGRAADAAAEREAA